MESTSGKLIQIMSIQEASTILLHASIANTDYPALYQSEWWDPPNGEDLKYTFAELDEGLYDIFLNFAEIYSSAMGNGLHVFDVMVQHMESILLAGRY